MALKSDAKIEGKLTCTFQNGIRNLSNFHRLKNSDFILENIPSRNKNSKHLDRPDAMRKQSRNRMMNTFMIVNITPTCKR